MRPTPLQPTVTSGQLLPAARSGARRGCRRATDRRRPTAVRPRRCCEWDHCPASTTWPDRSRRHVLRACLRCRRRPPTSEVLDAGQPRCVLAVVGSFKLPPREPCARRCSRHRRSTLSMRKAKLLRKCFFRPSALTQSCSASRFTAGAFGFRVLTHSVSTGGERVRHGLFRYGAFLAARCRRPSISRSKEKGPPGGKEGGPKSKQEGKTLG